MDGFGVLQGSTMSKTNTPAGRSARSPPKKFAVKLCHRDRKDNYDSPIAGDRHRFRQPGSNRDPRLKPRLRSALPRQFQHGFRNVQPSTSNPSVLVCRPNPLPQPRSTTSSSDFLFSQEFQHSRRCLSRGVREPTSWMYGGLFYRAWLLGMLQIWIDRERAVDHCNLLQK